jgi:hypothetical protein
MSLGRLLATGRSLAGGPSVGRYNVSQRNRLPKFGATKNPFLPPGSKSAAEQVRMPTVVPGGSSQSSPATNKPNNGPRLFARTPSKQTGRASATVGVALLKDVARRMVAGLTPLRALAAAAVSKVTLLAARIWERLRRVRREEPRPLLPRLGKPAVQTELSLDNVRVVRNDLEESDLEIVTAQTDTSAQVAPTTPPAAANRGPVPPALKKLTDRMLGVKLS